jgi:hypothetical protein
MYDVELRKIDLQLLIFTKNELKFLLYNKFTIEIITFIA